MVNVAHKKPIVVVLLICSFSSASSLINLVLFYSIACTQAAAATETITVDDNAIINGSQALTFFTYFHVELWHRKQLKAVR